MVLNTHPAANVISELLANYQELVKTSPVIAGMVSLYAMGVLTFALRSVPAKIWAVVKNQSTTTLSLLSTGAGSADMQYHSFLKWFGKKGFMRWSRSLAVESAWTRHADGDITPGNGTHYFMWRGRPCWLSKSRVETGGTMNQITHSITVGMLGRNHKLLHEMVDEFRWKPSESRGHLFYPEGKNGWSSSHRVSPRNIESVILNEGVLEKILDTITWFLENPEWYKSRGLAYRKIILLHGPPGTGKTSLLRALTSHFKRNLCPMSLSTLTEDALGGLLRSAPSESFILMEDFDACPAVLKPELRETGSVVSAAVDALMLNKSAILQAFDGVDVLDGQIIFLTTNYLDRIEPSIIRSERVNDIFYLGLLENEAIHRYIARVFPDEDRSIDTVLYDPIAGSELQRIYVKHHQNYRDFISNIPATNPDVETTTAEEAV